jgi:hypothetical protein
MNVRDFSRSFVLCCVVFFFFFCPFFRYKTTSPLSQSQHLLRAHTPPATTVRCNVAPSCSTYTYSRTRINNNGDGKKADAGTLLFVKNSLPVERFVVGPASPRTKKEVNRRFMSETNKNENTRRTEEKKKKPTKRFRTNIITVYCSLRRHIIT